jgi:flagellar export protein FliJ
MNRRRLQTLATLVRIRRRQEDLRALALAGAQRDVRVAQEQRDTIEAYQRRMLARAGEAMARDIDASAVRRIYQHERHLARMGSERDADVLRLQAAAEAKRRDLETALKSRRMIEQLENREVIRYREFRAQLEQKMHDEIATARVARRGAAGSP